MTTRVLVSDSLSDEGLAILRGRPDLDVDYRPGLDEEALAAALAGAAALVIRSGSKVTARVLAAATDLRVIGRAGIGVDNVDLAEASRRGVIVMNTPTGNAVTTAEHALALLLAVARHVPQASALLKAGRWEKKKFEGRELAGKTLGVIGLGNIGRIVADRARGLRMHVIGYDPMLSADRAAELGIDLVPLERIWEVADAITVHTPLTEATRGLVNDEVVARLKPGVLLVNCARGGIYDEQALLRGLASGRIGGVALDVFTKEPVPPDHPLLAHERVVVTPHLGASTREAQDRVAIEIAEQVVAFLATGAIQNAVNVPSVTSEIAPRLAPYTELARLLGAFLAQVEGTLEPRSIEIECLGEPAQLGARSIAPCAVAGFLERFLEIPINQVSAPHVAKDRGIAVRELSSTSRGGKYASLVGLRVVTNDGRLHCVDGTLGADGTPRLVRWNEFELEAHLGGPALVVTSIDRPGVIGFLGTTLGDNRINVARVHLGLAEGGRAASVWNLDAPLPEDVLEQVRQSPDITSAWFIS